MSSNHLTAVTCTTIPPLITLFHYPSTSVYHFAAKSGFRYHSGIERLREQVKKDPWSLESLQEVFFCNSWIKCIIIMITNEIAAVSVNVTKTTTQNLCRIRYKRKNTSQAVSLFVNQLCYYLPFYNTFLHSTSTVCMMMVELWSFLWSEDSNKATDMLLRTDFSICLQFTLNLFMSRSE